jgi:5-methylcytosine-specific restriction endonuclease McrA
MGDCCICRAGSPTDGNLIDGSVFHQRCYAQLKGKIAYLSQTETALIAELRRPLSFGGYFAMFFSDGRDSLLQQQRSTKDRIHQTREQLQATKGILVQIHDVWPGYPPDWDERRSIVRDRDNYGCAECGVGNLLHLHHRRPIRQGGTHRLDNLVLLCASCHSEAHGGKEFKYKGPQDVDDDSPNALEKKLALINRAIADKRDVQFRYKKRDGTITNRAVTPRELRKLSMAELRSLLGPKVKIEREGRLCLFGYCHLRRDKRTFAIDRMYKIALR